jgi:uroporphyrinogen decarboxylase
MNDKHNALEIIRFGRPQRVVQGPPCHWVGYFGVNHESFDGGGHHLPVGSKWTDIWGVGWRRLHEGVMGFPEEHPLADLPAAMKHYRWPDPDDQRLCGAIYENARGCDRAEKFLAGSHRDTLWEKSYMLCGMESMMCNFIAEPQATRQLLRRIMDFQIGMARHYLAAGIEIANLGDDLGTQHGLLLSPQIIHEFLVPEYRRLFDLYKSHNVLVNFHSCGHITPLLEMFIELGVNILNPVQATANDLEQVRQRTQGKMALLGGIASGLVMDGPPARIREEVRRRIAQLGQYGGYFCTADQHMPFPPAHRQAMESAIRDFGVYPLADRDCA